MGKEIIEEKNQKKRGIIINGKDKWSTIAIF